MAITLSLCNILAICRYLMNSLKSNIKCPTWNAWATSCLAETLKTHAGLVICLRYSIGRYQKHQQSLIYQMLLLTHSPMLHLDHPKGKLISSRRNELFCSLAMEFYHLKTPLKYTQLRPNRTTPNRSGPIPLHLPLTSPESPILSLPRHSLFLGQPACNNWSVRSSHLLPTQDNSEGPSWEEP